MKKIFSLVLVLVFALTVMAFAEEPVKVAFLNQDAANPSCAFMAKMFTQHAPTFNMELTCFDGKSDPQTQANQFNDCISQEYDVIIIAPNDPNSVVPSAMQAQKAGIAVVLFASDLPEEGQAFRNFYVGADDYAGGATAAQSFIDQFPDGANIVEIGGQSGHGATNKRHDGFMSVIEGSNINILDYQDCEQWDANDAMDIMQNLIVKHGDAIDGFFCHWDGGLSGCVQALKDAGIDPASKYSIGIDGNRDGFNNVREGVQAVSIMQNFDVLTYTALELTDKLLAGEEVPEINMPQWGIVTAESIDTFTEPEW